MFPYWVDFGLPLLPPQLVGLVSVKWFEEYVCRHALDKSISIVRLRDVFGLDGVTT